MNVAHLVQCPDGFAEMADVLLIAEDTQFPAHTQQLALHSRVIQELVLSTGPFSWQNPLILDTLLTDSTAATVAMLLKAVYLPGPLNMNSAEQAWRLYKVADSLDFPAVLQHCKACINNNSLTALLTTSGSTLEWLLAFHQLGLEGLKRQCVKKIACDYLAVSDSTQLRELPPELLLLIMQEMAEQIAQYTAKGDQEVRDVMSRRSGRPLCHSREDSNGNQCHDYKFFCDDINCPGHELTWSKSKSDNAQGSVTLNGTYFCDKGEIVDYAETQNLVDFPGEWQVLDAMLPEHVHHLFEAGYEHIQT